VIQHGDAFEAGARFDGQGSWPTAGHICSGARISRDAVAPAQALQAGGGQQDGVVPSSSLRRRVSGAANGFHLGLDTVDATARLAEGW
jgi:hypothetical protein